jgi:hypothetical protein
MMLITTIHAYDLLDSVQIKAVVRKYADTMSVESSIEFECTTTFQGTGESDPIEWLREALVGLLEDI